MAVLGMNSANNEDDVRGYAWPIRLIHWLMAILVIVMIIAGLAMVNGPWDGKFPPARGPLYDLHRGIGFILLILVVLRLLVYRFTRPPSPLPDSMPRWQKWAAETNHFLLYLLLIVQPLFGWYATNVWGVKNITVFGWFDLPALAEKNRELGNQLLAIHGYIGFAITALVGLHIAAAMKHYLIDKDNVLQRMLRT